MEGCPNLRKPGKRQHNTKIQLAFQYKHWAIVCFVPMEHVIVGRMLHPWLCEPCGQSSKPSQKIPSYFLWPNLNTHTYDACQKASNVLTKVPHTSDLLGCFCAFTAMPSDPLHIVYVLWQYTRSTFQHKQLNVSQQACHQRKKFDQQWNTTTRTLLLLWHVLYSVVAYNCCQWELHLPSKSTADEQHTNTFIQLPCRLWASPS